MLSLYPMNTLANTSSHPNRPLKIVITGGAGFIGSHTAQAWVDRGADVVVVDDLSVGCRSNIPKQARFLEMSILDPALGAWLVEEGCDALYHFAAQTEVRRSVADPVFDLHANAMGTLLLLQAAQKSGTQAFIFASSGGTIYGEQTYFPADEDHPKEPLSPYGISKRAAEHYLAYFDRSAQSPMRAISLRYGNVYGPGQNPHGEAGAVAIFTHKLLDGTRPAIFGDGSQTRDYVFIEDVVQANLLAWDQPAHGVFNIGTGIETSVNQLASMLLDTVVEGQASKQLEHHFDRGPMQWGDLMRSCLSCSKAQNELGWQAQTPIDVGMKKTVQAFKQARQAENQSSAKAG